MARNRRQQIAFDTLEQRFWALMEHSPDSGCWQWTGRIDSAGYGRFRGAKHLSSQLAHRNAWEFANRRRVPEGLHVLHQCDNRRCCNPVHLFLGTHQDNMDDRNKKGRQARLRGETSGTAKLTASQVEDVRRRLATGDAQTAIARDYGVSPSTIHLIKTGRNWAA